MHKKLAADLTSLAHSILQMKNKDDVFALQKKAHEVYEKLSVLAYVEEYINTTPNAEQSKEEIIELIENAQTAVAEAEVETQEEVNEEVVVHNLEDSTEEESQLEDTTEEEIDSQESVEASIDIEETIEEKVSEVEEVVEDVIEETEEEIEEVVEDTISEVKEDVEEVVEEVKEEIQETIELITEDLFGSSEESKDEEKKEEKVASLDEELKDTIAVDVVADLFESGPKKSLNDKLQGDIQIGLNDRIAFVKNLFGGSQEDFNRVVSQLNTFKTEKEAKKFITKMVKPDYDWSEKEEFEERFMAIVERKFA